MTVRRWVGLTLMLLALLLGGVGAAVAWHLHGLLTQARTALASRDYPLALEKAQAYLRWMSTDAQAHLLAARAARKQDLLDQAAEHLRQCRRAGGADRLIDLEFALIDVQRGKSGPVRSLRATAESDAENGPEILEVLTQFYLDTYLLQDARRCLDRYLEYRPDDLLALLTRARVFERLQYYPEALRDYRQAVAAHPESVPARLGMAQMLLISGTPGEAREQFAHLVETNQADRAARLGLARSLRLLGQHDEAIALLDALLRESADDGEALRERGQVDMDRGDPAGAEPRLQAASRLLPHDRETFHALAQCLRRLGRTKEAETAQAQADRCVADLDRLHKVVQAVMRSPNDAQLRYQGALLFLEHGELQEGMRWLEMTLKLDPSHAAARAEWQRRLKEPATK
jgi:tetratricopeptide (TPR) repeat protein